MSVDGGRSTRPTLRGRGRFDARRHEGDEAQRSARLDRPRAHVAYPPAVPVLFQRIESAAIAMAVVISFVTYGFAWWWLLVLFLAWDLSMIGYLVSPKAGAWTYNAVHSYV